MARTLPRKRNWPGRREAPPNGAVEPWKNVFQEDVYCSPVHKRRADMICAAVERCAGIDVGKEFLAVCVMTGPLQGEARKQTRRFGTIIAELERLRDWLKQEEVTHVVMESTGSYWKPVFNVLEDAVKVLLANPQEVKVRKGHKTDDKDGWWLAHLLRHAMIHPSFIPPRVIRELRDLTRRRKKLLGAGTGEKNRVQKILEDANVKLGNVLSDVFGVSGQLMLDALLKGKAEPTEIVAKIKEAGLEREWQLIQSAPGLKETSAANVLAEIGPDMSQFPSVRHISSWGGVCPGNNRSAGKNKSSHTTGGNPWLRAALTECAWAAAAKKGCFLKEKFWRITTKSGGKKAPAIVAVAHTVLGLVYEALRTGEPYQERKVPDLNPGQKDRMIRHHVKRLGKLGVTVRSNPLKREKKAAKTKNAKRT